MILISTLEPDSTDESGVMSNPKVNESPLFPGSARSLLVGLSNETQPDISSPPELCACTDAVHAVFPVFVTSRLFSVLVCPGCRFTNVQSSVSSQDLISGTMPVNVRLSSAWSGLGSLFTVALRIKQ